MGNIIQSIILYFLPNFNIAYLTLLPAVALLLVGIFIENHYTNRLTFFLNSVTLMAYFGVKSDIKDWLGLIVLAFFILSTWSFLSFISRGRIREIRWFEDLIRNNRWILRLGGSFVIGLVLLLDSIK